MIQFISFLSFIISDMIVSNELKQAIQQSLSSDQDLGLILTLLRRRARYCMVEDFNLHLL